MAPTEPPGAPRRPPAPVPVPAGAGPLPARVRELLSRYRQLDPQPATPDEKLQAVGRLADELDAESWGWDW